MRRLNRETQIGLAAAAAGALWLAACAPPLAPSAASAPMPIVTDTRSPDTTQLAVATLVAQKQMAGVALRAFQTAHPLVNPPRPTGIFDNTDPSYLAHGYAIRNCWQQMVDGAWLQADAGSLVSDPSQGVVLVVLAWPGRPQGDPILTPTRSGSVKFVAEHNNRLTLQSDNSTIYYFDVLGMTFTHSLTEVVPTVTPLPTYTPVPVYSPRSTGYP